MHRWMEDSSESDDTESSEDDSDSDRSHKYCTIYSASLIKIQLCRGVGR